MTDNTGAPTGQGPEGAESQGDAPQDQQQLQGSAQDTEASTDVSALQRELNEFKRDNAKYRAELRKLTDAKKAAEEANLSEQDRVTRRLADLEREREQWDAERRLLRIEKVVGAAASRLGFIDPDDALRNLNVESLEFTDDGQPRGVEKALKDILERKPHLSSQVAQAAPVRGVQPGSGSGSSFNDAIRRAAGVTR